MPVDKAALESRERRTLAPWAQFSADSRGRVYPEKPPLWRTEYQRDRDRVIHSRAFRRLEYKTQVFLNGTGDHLRTRLTHTMEVAAMARNIARALCLNEDLAETIALAHDLGHSPFGHNGEAVLDQFMRGSGGFEHNRQSLRIVEELEDKYPDFSGLNLTWEVREGLLKHALSRRVPGKGGFMAKSPSLEAQIANVADELIYSSHDLDDGLDAGLLSEAKLERGVKLFAGALRGVTKEHGALRPEVRRYFVVRAIIDMQIRDVVETSEAAIAAAKVQTVDDVRRHARPLIQYSRPRRSLNAELRRYLYKNLYFNPAVHEPNRRAVKMLEDLFHFYLKHPSEIGETSRQRARKSGLRRAVCDYLSGMTDRYAMLEHQRLFGLRQWNVGMVG